MVPAAGAADQPAAGEAAGWDDCPASAAGAGAGGGGGGGAKYNIWDVAVKYNTWVHEKSELGDGNRFWFFLIYV
jgi:hypothetical protein